MPEDKKEPVKGELTEKVESKVEKVLDETPTLKELQKQLDDANRSLTNKTEEAQRVHGKLKEFETAEELRKVAEMSDLEKAQIATKEAETKFKESQSELESMKQNNIKREVALGIGLPAMFALRIKGETPEEMTADAQALLDAMPKGQPKSSTTSPGSLGKKVGETDDDRRNRLLGRPLMSRKQ